MSETYTKEEMVRCPFCGSNRIGVTTMPRPLDSLPFVAMVECRTCETYGPSGHSDTEAVARADAICKWNARTTIYEPKPSASTP